MRKKYDIIPAPAKLEKHSGFFKLNGMVEIRYSDETESRRTAEYLSQMLKKRLSVNLPAVPHASGKGSCIILRIEHARRNLGPEGYLVDVSKERIAISAYRPAGLFYAVQTLLQLADQGISDGTDDIPVPCCRIEDIPRFSWRGMHLDVSRHFFPPEFIKKYLDLLALHKMNVFHWHLVDGAGWRIEIKKYPKLTEIGAWREDDTDKVWSPRNIRFPDKSGQKPAYGGFYTQEQIKDIVRYAKERQITVIPEIEMPGHSNAALASYPEYLCRNAEATEGEYNNSGVFCAGRDEVFTFLQDILDEVIGLFESEYIHIGADEVPKNFWHDCHDCQKRIKDLGLNNEEELQSYFVKRIEKYLISKGKKLIGWDEILEGGLAPEATVMSWRGMQGGIDAAHQGHDVIMCPGSHCYFDHYQGPIGYEPLAIGGYTTLKKTYSFEPVPAELNNVEAKHILGAQGNVWTEYMLTADHVEYMVLPRMSALAEVVWSPKSQRKWDDFRRRMKTMYKRYERWGYNYAMSAYLVNFNLSTDGANNGVYIKLETDAEDAEIRYTTDGTEPTKDSKLYTGPFRLTETAHIKAATFADGEMAGNVTSQKYRKHLASGKIPEFTFSVNPKYPGTGPNTLTNSIAGSLNFKDGQWNGFEGTDLIAVIDLGAKTDVSRIQTTFLQAMPSWIFMPEYVDYSCSDDGKSYTLLSRVENPIDPKSGETVIHPFTVEHINKLFRYLKIHAKNRGICPEWHQGAGGKSWIFADEIVVE